MCSDCYQIFDQEFPCDVCPVYKCTGQLVDIDDEIGNLISLLNLELQKYEIPIRTTFSCCGHLKKSFQPYIGFKIFAFNTEEAKAISEIFIDNCLDDLVQDLNNKICSSEEIPWSHKYESSFSILPDGFNEEEFAKYRVFVNGFNLKGECYDLPDIQRLKILNRVQFIFKGFLVNLVEKTKDLPDMLKNYHANED